MYKNILRRLNKKVRSAWSLRKIFVVFIICEFLVVTPRTNWIVVKNLASDKVIMFWYIKKNLAYSLHHCTGWYYPLFYGTVLEFVVFMLSSLLVRKNGNCFASTNLDILHFWRFKMNLYYKFPQVSYSMRNYKG